MTAKNEIQLAIASQQPISDEILTLMIVNIGNCDSQLRDELIYSSWKELFSKNLISLAQKRQLLNVSLTENLFFEIEKTFTDATFTRSFSSLLLAALIENHCQKNWLTDIEESQLICLGIKYMQTEKDYRGYVEEKGWAHAFAHGADLLKQLSRLEQFTSKDTLAIFDCIEYALFEVEEFLYGEEGRLARVISQLLKEQKITDEILANWLTKAQGIVVEKGYYNVWWLQFLKSLFFILSFERFDLMLSFAKINECLQIAYDKYRII
ncbi:hypothetical protein M2139_001143 [Enterococcus sp. PF1-24]|uniref:DUF2785 domain-containing protein n=1 Tax=unclassified Enterococcus TaxID=2608891 RepID=UPI002476ECA2|nr:MULTISPECIES: DUF2785 domain-containing protein [unclassified Enterococcus]MDH6364158.1 hypothetical protein [Enterococcus sp. PFB1-1]MDH6401259.1 hypothetical protein [Enterococcus sp. PF1-24]